MPNKDSIDNMKPSPYQHIYERDNYTCQYCDLDASNNFHVWWTANLSIDHIKPVSHGGSNDNKNLAVSCHTCNLYKGDQDCNSLGEAREIVSRKRREAERWFQKYVVKKSKI